MRFRTFSRFVLPAEPVRPTLFVLMNEKRLSNPCDEPFILFTGKAASHAWLDA
jgi:hypothetical protein